MLKIVKPLLKKILTAQRYTQLSSAYRKLNSFFEAIFLYILSLLPDRLLMIIKSSEIIRRMDYQNCDIFLNINSGIEYKVRLNSCKKEPEMIEFIQTFLKKGDVFYDIGANIGAYSLVAAKYFNGDVKVYSFEPSFLNFPQLCKNIIINNCSDRIIPLQIALSDQNVIGFFNYNNLISGGALHAFGEPKNQEGKYFAPVFRQPVLSYRLDDLIKHFRLPVPNHFKIDVDGIEYKILKGAEETFKNHLVRSIYLELEAMSDAEKNIIGFLKEKGFIIHSKSKNTYMDISSNMYNCIFQRADD